MSDQVTWGDINRQEQAADNDSDQECDCCGEWLSPDQLDFADDGLGTLCAGCIKNEIGEGCHR